MSETPVYYFSHGGPNTLYDTEHPVYGNLEKIGKEITSKVKPKAVVVISGHWQAADNNGVGGEERVEINFDEDAGLIYDFYNCPAHYYRARYPNKGSKEVASRVASVLQASGIQVEAVSRGLDHGVWICFKIAFDPVTNPLGVPIIQLSLPPESFTSPLPYHHLGAALAPLRAMGILLVVTGMPVHNLSSIRMTRIDPTPLPYTRTFLAALEEAVTAPAEEREEAMTALLTRRDLGQAHPSLEHLWPAFVGVGAAGSEKGEKVWGMGQGGLGWGIYRWGEIEGVE